MMSDESSSSSNDIESKRTLIACMHEVSTLLPWHTVPGFEHLQPEHTRTVNVINTKIQELAASHPQIFARTYMVHASIPSYYPLAHLLNSSDDGVCTNETIQAVIKAFPDAARLPNPQDGALPIHVACYGSSCSVHNLRLLYEVFPASALEKKRNGDTPLHMACFRRRWELAMFLVDVCPESAAVANQHGSYPLHLLVGRFIHPRQYRHMDEPERALMRNTVISVIRAAPSIASIKVRSNGLPLHDAVKEGMPVEIISELLVAYPTAIHNPEMHVSCWTGCSLDVCLILTKYYLTERFGRPLNYTELYPLHALLQTPAGVHRGSKPYGTCRPRFYKEELDHLDSDEYLPFHVAVHFKHWKIALEMLLEEPRAGTARDTQTGLYPCFSVALMGEEANRQDSKTTDVAAAAASAVASEKDWLSLMYRTLLLDPEIWLQRANATATSSSAC